MSILLFFWSKTVQTVSCCSGSWRNAYRDHSAGLISRYSMLFICGGYSKKVRNSKVLFYNRTTAFTADPYFGTLLWEAV
jgi:hypothetical protein